MSLNPLPSPAVTPGELASTRPGWWARLHQGLLRAWPREVLPRALMARYGRAGGLVRLEQELRLRICPFEAVLARVPARGVVLDLGCGYGVLAQLLASTEAGRQVLGIEQMPARVAVAQRVASGVTNLRFIEGDITRDALPLAGCIVMNDVLHHIPHALQIPLMKKCFQALEMRGLLLIKDVNKSSTAKYLWNYLHDFARNGNLPFYCLDTPVMVALLELVGFQVEAIDLATGYPYPHVLYICRKP